MKRTKSFRSAGRCFDLEPLEGRELYSVVDPLAGAFAEQQTLAPAVLPPTSSVTPASWVGGAAGDWNTTGNWSINAVPGANNSVSIPSGVTVTISSGAQSINSLQASGNLSITGGSLSITADSTISGNFTLSGAAGASLSVNGTLTVSSATLLENGATILGSGTLANSGSLTSTAGTNISAVFNNSGTVEVTSGILSLTGGGTNSGIWDADSGTTVNLSGTALGYTFNPGSQWNGSGLYVIGQFSFTLSGYAPVVIASGLTLSPLNLQMTNDGNLEIDGTLTIPANGIFSAGAEEDQQLQITGTGTLNISQGATMQIGVGQGWLSVTGTTINNHGTMAFDADSALVALSFDMESNATLFNFGTMEVQNQGGTPAGTLSIGGFGFLNNFGTVDMQASAPLTMQLQLNNDGPFNVSNGSVNVTNDGHAAGSSFGTFTVASGSTLEFSSSQSLIAGASFGGTGAYELGFGDELTLNSAALNLSPFNFTLNGGTIDGLGQFSVATGSTFAWNGGKIATSGGFTVQNGVTIAAAAGGIAGLKLDGATLSNAGEIDFTSDVTFSNGAVLQNQATGIIKIQIAGEGFFLDDHSSALNNAGTLEVFADATPGNFTDIALNAFSNTGTLVAETGHVEIAAKPAQISADGTTLTGGIWIAGPGATLTLFGIESGQTTTVTTNAATVVLEGAGSSFNALSNLTTNGGEIELGSAASLSLPGNFTQTAAGTLLVHIDGRSASGLFGSLGIAGTANLGGALDIDLDGFSPFNGDAYAILTYGSATGLFATQQNVAPTFNAIEGGASYTLTVQSANFPDLSVSNISGTATAVSGQDMTVTYTVTNAGTGDATGSWQDSIYISPGTTFDPLTAVLLGSVAHLGGLASGDSYIGSLTATAPGVIPGNYSIIVVADSLGQVSELSRANGEAASASSVTFTAPMLTLNTPLNGTIANGGQQLYELDLDSNSLVQLSLQTAAAAGAQIYVSYGTAPSPSNFDETAFNVTGPNAVIRFDAALSGPYYILVAGRASSGSGAAFTLTAAKTSQLAVTSLSPVGGSGMTTITLQGAQFSAGDTVSLIPAAGGSPLAATNFFFTASTKISATFDFTGVAAGTAYNVQVSDGANTVTVPSAFTVGAPTNVSNPILVTITAPQFVRAGVDYTIQVNYANVSGQDQLAPLLTLSAINGLLKLPQSLVFAAGVIGGTTPGLPPDQNGSGIVATVGTIAFLAVNTSGGPAGILPPGYQGSMTVDVHQTEAGSGTVIAYGTGAADPSKPMDYAALEPYVDSQNYTASDWAALWTQVQAMLGPTQAGYLKALSNAATLLPAVAGDNTNPIDDMQIVLAQAQAAVTTSISGRISTKDPGLQLGGLFLDAVNSTTGDSFGTYILNDGSFVLPKITPGSYTFTVDGAIAAAAPPVAVAAGQQVTGVTFTAGAGATLTGVTSSTVNGSILAGATIKIEGANGEGFTTTSDASGRYQLAGLPADTYTIIATALSTAQFLEENFVLGSGGQVLNLSLVPQATITGTITPASGTGGVAPTVIAEPPGNTDPNLIFQVAPNGNGSFSLSNLPAGTYNVTISLNGFVTDVISNVNVSAGATHSLGAINLASTGSVSGTVTSSDPNLPVNGAAIGAYQNGTLVASASANASGAYSITGLAAGSYVIEPIGYSFFSNAPQVTISAGQAAGAVAVHLQPGGVISGTVTNLSNGLPLTNLAVYATNSSGTVVVAYTDATGAYSFQHLALGTYKVASAFEASSQAINATITTLDPTPVSANFQPAVAQSISGQLFLGDGSTPAANGEVALLQNGQVVATSSTDATGRYNFLLQQPGTFDLQASAGNATYLPVTNVSVSAGQSVTKNFSAGAGAIHLTVTDSTESVAGASVDVFQVSTNLEVGYAVLTDNGQFSLSNLVDGDYRIVIGVDNDGFARGAVTTITVSGGATVTTAVPLLTQAIVNGSITDANTGQPISNAYVGAYSTTDPSVVFYTPVEASGLYLLANVPFGSYDLVAFANGYASSIQHNVTINGGSDNFNFALSTSGSTALIGQVVDQNGSPLPGSSVAVLNASSEIIGFGTTDANGRFNITSATGPNLVLRITTPPGLTIQVAETGPGPDEVVDTGQLNLFSSNNGEDNFLNNALGAIGGLFQSISSGIQSIANPANPLQPLITELETFNAVKFTKLTEPTGICPDAKTNLKILNDAIDKANDAADTVMKSQLEAIVSAERFFLSYSREFVTNLTTALQSAAALLSLSPQVISALKDAPLIGPAVPGQLIFQLISTLEGACQGMAGLVSTFLNTRDQFGKATVESNVEAIISGGVNGIVGPINDLNGLVSGLVGFVQAALEKSGANPAFGVLSQFSGLATTLLNGLGALQFDGTSAAATALQSKLTKFIQDRGAYDDAVDKVFAAAAAYDRSSSNSSGGCGNHGQGGGATSSLGPHPSHASSTSLSGHDPNDLFGPAGFGPQNFILPSQPLGYRIDFENDPGASASTAVVTITETLDANLDLSTFQLGAIGFGGITLNVPAGLTSYSTIVDDTAATGLDVRVEASLNVQTRVVTWTFTSIDPATGQPPANPLAGFLPPDVTAPEGLGFVTYTASAKADLSTGTTISALASVVFDANAPIDTAVFTNTLDAAPPTTAITALPANEAPDFTLRWSAVDDIGGSGIATYNVFVSTNGGAFQPFLLGTTQTAAAFSGVIGNTYGFYVTAEDNVGNEQLPPPSAEAVTTIVAPQTFTVTAKKSVTFTDADGDKVTVKLSGPGSVVGTLEGGVASNADLRSLVLDGTTSKSSLSVTVAKGGSTPIAEIFTAAAGQSLGSLTLGPKVLLGDGLADGTTALAIGGSVKSLKLGEIQANAQIKIGSDLTGAALTAEHPALSTGAVLGAGVSIGATGGLGAVKMASWSFNGLLEASLGIASLTVAGPMLANVTAASMGNLTATALESANITISNGSLGNVTVKGGSIDDVTISVAGKMGNISASPSAHGLDNVAISALVVTAGSIGNITAAMPANGQGTESAIVSSSFTATTGNIGAIKATVASPSAAHLTGIDSSDFTAHGAIGKVTVSAKSTSTKAADLGDASGIATTNGGVNFDAGTSIGAITVTATGAGDTNVAMDGSPADRIQFLAGTAIGAVKVTSSVGKASGSSAFALAHTDFTAGTTLGAVSIGGHATGIQADDWQVYAGGSIAGISVTSTIKAEGGAQNSTILAGQLVSIGKNSDLSKAGIGFVTLSGSFVDSDIGQSTIGARGNIGAIRIGGALQNARIVAGLDAGGDHLAYSGDDSYNDAASVASVTIGGIFSGSSIIAGVAPGAAETWGGAGDAKGAALSGVTQTSRIGSIVLGAGTLPAGASTALSTPLVPNLSSAIEAPSLSKLTIGKLKALTDFNTPGYLDINGNGEDSGDTAVRLITA